MGFNYSVMLDVENKPILVVGGGKVAKRKIQDLLSLNANVTVIAPHILEEIVNDSHNGSLHCLKRSFELSDIDTYDPFVVFAATDNVALNKRITTYCNTRRILVNSITEPFEGSLSVQATIRKPQYAISVSTYGKGPGFSKALKEYLEKVLDNQLDLAVQIYIDLRHWLFTVYEKSDDRIHYLRKLSIEQICSIINDEENLEYEKLLEKVKEWLSCS